jgi:nitroreductase
MPIRPDLPPEPVFGEPLAPTHESAETLRLLALRRSTPAAALTDPGPDAADIDMMLRLAARVPDHRKLEPWRFLIVTGDDRHKLGDLFASRPTGSDADRALPLRAPTIIAVVSSPVHDDPKKTPVWEQELSAGAVCQTLMLAACAMGWAACWLTEAPAFDRHVAAGLGLADHERIAGFIYVGTAKEKPVERARPDLAKKARRWPG